MKILQLKLKNIQSLAGEHLIPLGSNTFTKHGIFLICGPTGSGKTTILDAICMALYESAPRMGKLSVADIDGQGMLVTRNALHAFTEIEYEMGGGNRYKSIWKAERTARSSSFGAAHVKMELYQWVQNQWHLISDKKAEVIKNNESIIGLDFNQFRMAVLLAQGDFAKLLKADTTTRSELLERVTGKTIFKKIGALIFAKTSEIKNEKSHLLAKSSGVVLLTGEEIIQRNSKIEALAQDIQKQFEQIQEILTGISWWKTEEKLQAKKVQIDQLSNELEQAQRKFHVHAHVLEQHEKASPIIPMIEKWKMEHFKLNDAQKQISDSTNQLQQIDVQLGDLFKKVTSTCSFSLTEQSWINELQLKKSEAQSERDAIHELKNKSNEKKERIHAILQPWEWTVDKPFSEAALWLQEKQHQWKNLPFSIDALPNQISILEDHKNQAWVWQQKCAAESEVLREINGFKSSVQVLTDEKTRLDENAVSLISECNKLEIEVTSLQFEVQGLRNFASAAELRATLVDQQPCPVCGSTDHPFSNSQFDNSLKESEEKLATTTEKLSAIQSKRSTIDKKIQETESNIFFQNQQIETLNSKAQELSQEIKIYQIPSYASANEALEFIEKTLPAYKNILQESVQYTAIESIVPDWKEYVLLQKQIEEKTLIYFETFPKDFIALSEQWIQEGMLLKQRSSDTNEQLQLKKSAFSILQQENRLLEQELNQQAITYGFKNYTDAMEAIQPQELAQSWRNELLTISSLQKSIQDQNNNLLEEVTQHQKNTQPQTNKEDLESEYQQLNTEREKLISEKGALEEQLKINDHNQQIFKGYQNQIHEIDEKLGYWEILNNKIGDKNGNKFSKIAQQFTLDLLIQLANVKLKEFRARYQLHLEKQDDGLGKIMVIDEFLGGQLRNVETLSGGETFLTSLSLAMALSDFAANNAQLNTLFIDEGFGTLDPDSLANAMEAIDQIRSTSQKTIGLISHVQELRERIACQIEVIPKGNGKSVLEIRG